MEKMKCTLSYDGTNYSGFQIQENGRTIQGEIEKALKKIHKGKSIRIQASGRTDAGVHARAQVIHFETDLYLSEESWQRALNTLLPADIYIHQVVEVPESFHARFDAIAKEYHYFVFNRKERDVFRKNYFYHFPHALDIEAMQAACQYFIGEHDFTACCSTRSTIKGSKVRTLTKLSCEKQGDEIKFVVRGNGFLQHMVRIIVGTLMEVGQGLRNPEEIPVLLEKKDRRLLGKTVPAQGLYLLEVEYPSE